MVQLMSLSLVGSGEWDQFDTKYITAYWLYKFKILNNLFMQLTCLLCT